MDQDGAKRIERRSANRGKLAERISEIRYRILDVGDESFRYPFERHTVGWHTDKRQSVQSTQRDSAGATPPRRETSEAERHSLGVGTEQETNRKGRRSQTGRAANQPPTDGRYHPVDFLWAFRENGGVVVNARNPLPVGVGK